MSQTFNKRSFSSVLPSQTIFLTGATGILGAYLVKDLLASTNSDIYCLVRADTASGARERLASFLAIYEPEGKLRAEFERRVIPVLGDIVHEDLGLSPSLYRELTEKVDVTIHVAALTNLFINYRRICPINLGGARNIVQFCLKTRNQYLCHVSTHTVMGDKTFDPSVIYRETDLDIGQGFDHMAYQRTKFEAEKVVREAAAQGLVWNIMRPGQIFGDAMTGRYPHGQANITGLFYDIFKTVTESRVALYSRTHFDVTPVDFVSRGIIELGLRRNSYFETYHLTNPDMKRYCDVIQLISELGYPIEIVSQDEYRHRLFARELVVNGVEYKSPTTSAFKWWYKRDIDFSDSAVTNCDYTKTVLAASGVQCPPVDVNLIGTYFEVGTAHGYFKATPSRPAKASAKRRAKSKREFSL